MNEAEKEREARYAGGEREGDGGGGGIRENQSE